MISVYRTGSIILRTGACHFIIYNPRCHDNNIVVSCRSMVMLLSHAFYSQKRPNGTLKSCYIYYIVAFEIGHPSISSAGTAYHKMSE